MDFYSKVFILNWLQIYFFWYINNFFGTVWSKYSVGIMTTRFHNLWACYFIHWGLYCLNKRILMKTYHTHNKYVSIQCLNCRFVVVSRVKSALQAKCGNYENWATKWQRLKHSWGCTLEGATEAQTWHDATQHLMKTKHVAKRSEDTSVFSDWTRFIPHTTAADITSGVKWLF